MRTLDLLKALSQPELKEVETLLSDVKRKNLLSLFKELKKYRSKETEPQNKYLFQKVFAQKYSKEDDHLLRNKLSRLNDIIYEYLVLTEFKSRIATNKNLFNLWLMQAYHKRKMPMLRTDLPGFIHTALEELMLDEASPMLRLRSLLEDGHFEKDIEKVNQWQLLEKRRFALHTTLAESTKALYYDREANRLQSGNKIWKNYRHPDYRFDFNDVKDEWYFRLYENNRLAMVSRNEDEHIQYLKKAEAAIVGIKSQHMLLRGVRGNIMLNIAYGLIKKRRFTEAAEYLEKHIAQQKSEEIAVAAVGWINYMVVLCCTEQLEEAKSVYHKNKAILGASALNLPALIMYCAACLFTNQPDAVVKAMPDLNALLEHEKLVLRNLYIVAFILRGEHALAHTEAINLKRAITGFEQTDYIRDLGEITLVLHNYILALTGAKQKQKALFEKVSGKAKQLLKLFEDDPVQSLTLKWLIRRTEAGKT